MVIIIFDFWNVGVRLTIIPEVNILSLEPFSNFRIVESLFFFWKKFGWENMQCKSCVRILLQRITSLMSKYKKGLWIKKSDAWFDIFREWGIMHDFVERKYFLFFFSKFWQLIEKIVMKSCFSFLFILKRSRNFLSYLLFGGWVI